MKFFAAIGLIAISTLMIFGLYSLIVLIVETARHLPASLLFHTGNGWIAIPIMTSFVAAFVDCVLIIEELD